MAKKRINLALQGGGAHGAYTWGVLDRLLEEEDFIIEGISGTSAGAMNAAMLVNGYMQGDRQGAKDMLHKFWWRVSEAALLSPLHKSPLERMLTGWNMDVSPMYQWFDMLSRVFSPYELNPLDINPMRQILEDLLDPELVQACSMIKLFITATHVSSGQPRVFECHEINTEVLLASACIPFVFQAVEIDGEHYWDGGYMGNPAIWPLIYYCQSEDVLLVQINPIHSETLPKSAHDIINRLNEISFNSSLIAEMRAIDFVSKLIAQDKLERGRYKALRVHLIYAREEMHRLNASSKMNADWDFFLFLKELGRQQAETWLKTDWKHVGQKSTIDIHEKFLTGPGRKSWQGMPSRKQESVTKKPAVKKPAVKQRSGAKPK